MSKSIKQSVKETLAGMKNVNGATIVDSVFDTMNAGMRTPMFSREQIRRAMNDLSKSNILVRKIDKDTYHIKGRRVS